LTFRFLHGSDAVTVTLDRQQRWRAVVDGVACLVEWSLAAPGFAIVTVDGERQEFNWTKSGEALVCWLGGCEFHCRYDDPRQLSHSVSADEGALTARLPGTVVMVGVKPGERVAPGSILMVIEAMKMEHAVLAPYAGIVGDIHFEVGHKVPAGATLIELQRLTAD
jgi:biotin carboxyl carrier protein